MWLTFSGVRGCIVMMVKKRWLFAVVCAWFFFFFFWIQHFIVQQLSYMTVNTGSISTTYRLTNYLTAWSERYVGMWIIGLASCIRWPG